MKGGIQRPPAPGGPNEQEEVMDLVDGEQRKAAGFDNMKPGGMEGGAGGPNEDANDGEELQNENNEEDQDDPLPNPIQDPNNNEDGEDPQQLRGNNGADDDEGDDGDYGAVEEQEGEKNHRENPNFEVQWSSQGFIQPPPPPPKNLFFKIFWWGEEMLPIPDAQLDSPLTCRQWTL